MKKTLAIVLTLVLALSCCGMIFASAASAETFWITHYDDATVEGAGIIMTGEDTTGVWNDHYAFKPIDGVKNGYELVEISYGTIANGDDSTNGHGEALAVPAGGFVYSTSIGNNYLDLGLGDTNYVNDNCNAQISRCRTWKVGDQFIITGLDLEGKTVPTSTSGKGWYEADYVCTATIVAYDPSNPPADDGKDDGNTGSESTGSTSSPATSTSSETSKVPTGDNGIIVFAVLGLFAVAGAAVCVKIRH